MKCVSAVLCIALFAQGSLAAELNKKSSAWPQWRGPQRTGISTETGLNTDWQQRPPALLWKSVGFGEGFASVSIAGGRIYTTGNLPEGQAVIAASEVDGSVLWARPLTEKPPRHGYQGSRCTPTIDGDRLYVVASDGTVACLDAAQGKILWQRDMKSDFGGRMMSGWGYSESPLVDGDKLVCTPGGKDAMIVALDKMTGKEIWRSAMPEIGSGGRDGAGYSSMVVSEAREVRQYVQLVGRGVIGVRAGDGQFLWGYNRVANGTANIPTPLVSGDYVFASSGYNTGSALLRLTGGSDGRIEAEEAYFLNGNEVQNHHGGMLLLGDYIYMGHKHNNGLPVCVKMETGEIAWGGDVRGPGRGSAAIVYADGHIIFRYQSGEVGLIEATPEEYRLKGSFKAEVVKGNCWAHPVVHGGRLYLREQDELMCYDLSP